jgi:Glycosyl hydrolase family 63 C-terminal domain
MRAEEQRLQQNAQRGVNWARWGPYLSERQWGTVREDYSPDGEAWNYFPHDHARSRVYRWGEDGIAGICDRHQHICFALTLWNEKDPILKERLFGLTNREGNHGEDVKECYFYLDATPTSSYLKCLYKYPQAAFPYDELVAVNASRTRQDPEYELLDTGVFRENRYFDVFVEYSKATSEDILIRITAWNCAPEAARLHLLPTLWFRNRWSWGDKYDMPVAARVEGPQGTALIESTEYHYGKRWLIAEGAPELLFTENETNQERLFQVANRTPYVKDAFDRYLIHGERAAVNPAMKGTKAAAHYAAEVAPGKNWTIRLRLTDQNPVESRLPAQEIFGSAFDALFQLRQKEADEFYAERASPEMSADLRLIQRQAFAGLHWSRQSYHYEVKRWLDGDPTMPPPDPRRRLGRNHQWVHLYNSDVILMPDKWEYPWYAAWDLAFHCVALATVDPDFAKRQLILFLREWYMHPNGELPAYEWNFSNVNPPVHAWAALRVYQIERRICGKGDRKFLVRIFHKLLLNFTWWVNRKDPEGMNVFEGGFLGLDNIGIFDRSQRLPAGATIEQSDGTSWMAWFSLTMLGMAMELAREDIAYEDVASKFFEHFVYIMEAMNRMGGEEDGLWDETDGFYYDMIHMSGAPHVPLKIRSMVGIIPLFAVWILNSKVLERLPGFAKRMQWFLDHRPSVKEHLDLSQKNELGARFLLAIANRGRLERMLRYIFDENEFLSPYGIRSLSKVHRDHPFTLHVDGQESRVDYEPAESSTDLFGGNSNWRGPIWFPLNYLLIEALQRYDYYYGNQLQVEFPTGSGKRMSLGEVSSELSRRLMRIFERRDGRRPVYGDSKVFQEDPRWRDLILFNEYFHGETGEGLGASHQTGWTALVAKLIEQSGK